MKRSLGPRHRLVVLAVALFIASCGGDASGPNGPVTTPAPVGPTTTTIATPVIGEATVVLVAELTGGCMMMGPNCPTYVLWDDGRAVVVRGAPPVDPFTERIDDGFIEAVGFIDATLAAAVGEAVSGTDFAALERRLGPGRCNGCVDGIDTTISMAAPSGRVHLSSIDVEFDEDEPFFAAVGAAVSALQRELALPIQSR
jgi:hypothetical protein